MCPLWGAEGWLVTLFLSAALTVSFPLSTFLSLFSVHVRLCLSHPLHMTAPKGLEGHREFLRVMFLQKRNKNWGGLLRGSSVRGYAVPDAYDTTFDATTIFRLSCVQDLMLNIRGGKASAEQPGHPNTSPKVIQPSHTPRKRQINVFFYRHAFLESYSARDITLVYAFTSKPQP